MARGSSGSETPGPPSKRSRTAARSCGTAVRSCDEPLWSRSHRRPHPHRQTQTRGCDPRPTLLLRPRSGAAVPTRRSRSLPQRYRRAAHPPHAAAARPRARPTTHPWPRGRRGRSPQPRAASAPLRGGHLTAEVTHGPARPRPNGVAPPPGCRTASTQERRR